MTAKRYGEWAAALLAFANGAKKEGKYMKITKTINTATVNMATVALKDGKAETAMTVTVLHSCDPLSDEKIAKAVRKIDPKATVVSVTQRRDKYSIDIAEFVKVAHVEQ